MNPNNEQENQDRIVDQIEDESSLSIEDFIKQLEARERDLHISSTLAIEVEEAEFDDTNPEEFARREIKIEPVRPVESPMMPDLIVSSKTFSELQDEVSELESKVARLEADRAEMASTMRRRQIDFDNFRKRIERERGDTFLSQLSNLASQILPVLDNMNRALDFAERHSEGKSQDFHEFYRGIVLVNQQLSEVLAVMGINPIASVGEPFDPHFHEAVATEQREDIPTNTVTAELLRGYRIGDKVIRAAMVKVSTSPRPQAIQSNDEDDFLGLD